ncbi:MAG: sigma-54 dependent transcriptional regulator [Sandaracinaceae bacterium]|nr:sigma-54 dependent transcriptional regulator [Sandaracinaceae bacterium]
MSPLERTVPARVLVCDDEASLREMLGVLLRRAGYVVELVGTVETAKDKIVSGVPYDAVITDLSLPDGSGMDVLATARTNDDSTQVIVITAYGTTEHAVQAMRLGAYDYIQKPFRNHEILALLEKALEKRDIVGENRILRAKVEDKERATKLLGRSVAMQRVLDLVRRVASSPTSVLITGESGTGKEMVARALHDESTRAKKPFVVVNCAAIPEPLMESELFGHEKGAFTGAHQRKDGLFKIADGGTLFLDEVGELPLGLQVKLLRVLQERVVRPVGAGRDFEVDVRVIAATNRLLEQEVTAGRFRQDLFYRLNVIRVHLPPLRERTEDIPALAEHFLRKHGTLQGKRLGFHPDALRWIERQPYPGNVRELENVVERAVAFAAGSVVTVDDLPAESGAPRELRGAAELPKLGEGGFDLDGWLSELERAMVVKALEQAGGRQKVAAQLLQTSFHSFRYRLRKYGLADDEGPP